METDEPILPTFRALCAESSSELNQGSSGYRA